MPDVVEHLVGLQAQTPHSWYVGLWSRIAGFRPDVAVDLITGRELVRIALMRSTIHLVTAADAWRLRPPSNRCSTATCSPTTSTGASIRGWTSPSSSRPDASC